MVADGGADIIHRHLIQAGHARGDVHWDQALRTAALHELDQLIRLSPRVVGTTLSDDRSNRSATGDHRLENAES